MVQENIIILSVWALSLLVKGDLQSHDKKNCNSSLRIIILLEMNMLSLQE